MREIRDDFELLKIVIDYSNTVSTQLVIKLKTDVEDLFQRLEKQIHTLKENQPTNP